MRDLSFLTKKPIAHRGIHYSEPENTISAFKKAIEKGYPIELDVQLSKDNEVVVFHDSSLYRLSGIDKKVGSLNYDELKELCLNDSNEKIPTLKDSLKTINGKVPVIIELKGNQKGHLLEEKVAKILDKYKGKFCIKSFNHDIVRWFYHNRPNFIRGLLLSSRRTKSSFKQNLMIRLSKPDFISCNYQMGLKKVKRWRKKRPVFAWTIRDNDCFKRYQDNFDNLIVDFNKEDI